MLRANSCQDMEEGGGKGTGGKTNCTVFGVGFRIDVCDALCDCVSCFPGKGTGGVVDPVPWHFGVMF